MRMESSAELQAKQFKMGEAYAKMQAAHWAREREKELDRRRHVGYWVRKILWGTLKPVGLLLVGAVYALCFLAGLAVNILCLFAMRDATQWFLGTGNHARAN